MPIGRLSRRRRQRTTRRQKTRAHRTRSSRAGDLQKIQGGRIYTTLEGMPRYCILHGTVPTVECNIRTAPPRANHTSTNNDINNEDRTAEREELGGCLGGPQQQEGQLRAELGGALGGSRRIVRDDETARGEPVGYLGMQNRRIV